MPSPLEPEILLMDEPFAALDAQMRKILQEQLLELWQGDRRTVLFITHSLEEAILLGDRVVVMSARPGTIVASKQVPFDRPRDASIRETPEFAAFEAELWELLRVEVERHLAESMMSEAIGVSAIDDVDDPPSPDGGRRPIRSVTPGGGDRWR